MCSSCRPADGWEGPPDLPCDCPCPIRQNSAFLKFRPLICTECSHIAMD
jgi:hypothetical protein